MEFEIAYGCWRCHDSGYELVEGEHIPRLGYAPLYAKACRWCNLGDLIAQEQRRSREQPQSSTPRFVNRMIGDAL